MPAPNAEGAPAINPVADALSRAKAYTLQFATAVAADSYPPETQEAAPPKPEPKAEVEEEAGETTQESEAESQPEETEEEQAPEEETEPTAEADEEEDSEPAEDEEEVELAPEIQQSINKRIGKEVAKTKAERKAREDAEKKVAELEMALGEKTGGETRVVRVESPLSEIVDQTGLHKKQEEVEGLKQEVADLLDCIDDDPDDVAAKLKAARIDAGDYSPRAMKRALRHLDKNLDKVLTREIPARAEFLKTETDLKEKVFEQMPELRNPASPTARAWRQVLEQVPELKLNPRWPLFAAALTAYAQAATQAAKSAPAKAAAAKAKTTAPPPKIPAKAKTTPSPNRAAGKMAEQSKLREAMMSGDSEARVKLLESILE